MLETEFTLLPSAVVISRPQLPLGKIEMTAGGGGRGLTYGRSFRRACKLGTAIVAASMDERQIVLEHDITNGIEMVTAT